MPSMALAAVDYLEELGDVLHSVSNEVLERTLEVLLQARADGRRIYVMGNGGSAAIGIVDIAVHVPYQNYGLVEDTHMAIGHALTRALIEATQPDTRAAAMQ